MLIRVLGHQHGYYARDSNEAPRRSAALTTRLAVPRSRTTERADSNAESLLVEVPHRTAAEIVRKVTLLLKTSDGQARIAVLREMLRTMQLHARNVSTSLKLARSRSTAGFYTSASKAASHQPVLYPPRGLPFQFPMPIGARAAPTLGQGTGHVDVLARAGRGGRCLRVFEVKRPNASDVEHALHQAVAYCAAVRFLLTESTRPESEVLYKVLGFRGQPAKAPRVEAVAVVNDTPVNRERISAAAVVLEADSPSPIGVFATFYTTSGGSTQFGPIVPVGSRR